MTSAVDGLVSGLGTSSLINQLMTVEAAPQTRLKSKATTAQKTVDAYQSVNTKMTALKSAGDALSQLSTWRGIKATSSSSSVTATALTGTNTATGTTVFDVKALAKNQIATARVPASGDIMTGNALTIDVGPLGDPDPAKHKVTNVPITDRSAKGVADAINAANLGVKAMVITTGGGENVLQLSGSKTGAAGAFTINGLDQLAGTGLLKEVAAAGDARLEIGRTVDPNDPNAVDPDVYVVTSSTNTFSNLMPGVTMTVSKIENDVTIDATADVQGIADKFQAMVDAANAALDEIGKQTAYDANTKSSSTLTGDFGVRNMTQLLLGTVSKGVIYPNPDYDPKTKTPAELAGIPQTVSAGSYAKYGIQLDSTGRLSFNADKFKASYAEDPVEIQKVGMQIGGVFETLADGQSVNLKSTITGRKNEIDSINSQISNWDVRLSAKRLALQKQYADLEVALGNLKNQSNWLAGQLGGLGGG